MQIYKVRLLEITSLKYMFGLFKSNKVTKEQNVLLLNIFEKLPPKYKPFADQIKAGLLNRTFQSSKMIPNFISFSYQGKIAKVYERHVSAQPNLKSFEVG